MARPVFYVAVMRWLTVVVLIESLYGFCFAQEPNGTAPEKPVLERITDRDFPSIFQAWNQCDSLPEEDTYTTLARHDLYFTGPSAFGLKWNNDYSGLSDAFLPDSIKSALKNRTALLQKNPNMIILSEIRYYDANSSYLPEDHDWFMRDPNGSPVPGWEEGKYWRLDLQNPAFQEHVAKQAGVAVASGVFDGIMLDWWKDDKDRLELIKTIRKTIGPEALILCNANDRKTPDTAPFINGYFMECYRTATVQDWERIAETLRWAEENLCKPTINCLETWHHNSRQDVSLMRATTTLAMTLSDGYCLFSDPNPLPTPDHLHDWYPFWEARPGKSAVPGKRDEKGCYVRPYDNAIVIYNPMGNPPATYHFSTPLKSAATGKISTEHTLQSCDGDILLYL